MQSQQALVDIAGRFIPKIVKMDGAAPKQWRKNSLHTRIDEPLDL